MLSSNDRRWKIQPGYVQQGEVQHRLFIHDLNVGNFDVTVFYMRNMDFESPLVGCRTRCEVKMVLLTLMM
jgi:hypothetical protein